MLQGRGAQKTANPPPPPPPPEGNGNCQPAANKQNRKKRKIAQKKLQLELATVPALSLGLLARDVQRCGLGYDSDRGPSQVRVKLTLLSNYIKMIGDVGHICVACQASAGCDCRLWPGQARPGQNSPGRAQLQQESRTNNRRQRSAGGVDGQRLAWYADQQPGRDGQ